MSEAIELAKMMAGAKLVPAALQKSPADCLMVILQAIRWQMDPFAVAQECSVIQGKLMLSGKLVAAVINSRGNLAERLTFTYAGTNGDRSITVTGRLQGETEPRTVTVKLRDASTSAKVWTTQPDQQLMYHGVRVWARRHVPELMLGVYSPEEFDEDTTVGSRRPTIAPVEIAAPEPAAPPEADPVTGELGPREILVPMNGDTPDWIGFGQGFIQAVKSSEDMDEAQEWLRLNRTAIDRMEREYPKVHRRMCDRIAEHVQSLSDEAVSAAKTETATSTGK
jgi:hypothetical protein